MKLNSFQKISIACIVADIITAVIILIIRKSLPPLIPLFYGLPVSDSQLAPSIALVIPPFVSAISVGINLGFNSLLKDSFIQQVLTGLTLALTALAVITVIKIILLV